MNDDTFQTLLLRHTDGTLAPDENAAFNQHLGEDAGARAELIEIATQAVAMGDIARSQRQIPRARPAVKSTPLRWASPIALAASLALLAISAWLFIHRQEAPVVTLIEATGSINWSQGGNERMEVQVGVRLPAGTLETIGETATAQLQFADGSLVMLTGESELSFSETDQKRLVLRVGTLNAQVKPQPTGRPMLIRTPSAEAQVLGTTFTLNAAQTETTLNVETGLVRLRRLADGETVEVAGQQSALASLNSDSRMKASGMPPTPTSWTHDMKVPPPVEWRGRWLPANADAPARIKAMPYKAGRNKENDLSVIHYGVSFHSPEGRAEDTFLSVTAGSVLLIRCRAERSASLRVFIGCQKERQSSGGNFESKVFNLPSNDETWQTVELKLVEFVPNMPRHRDIIGTEIYLLLVHTISSDAGLEISEISIHP